jgi:hypothetical protein
LFSSFTYLEPVKSAEPVVESVGVKASEPVVVTDQSSRVTHSVTQRMIAVESPDSNLPVIAVAMPPTIMIAISVPVALLGIGCVLGDKTGRENKRARHDQ